MFAQLGNIIFQKAYTPDAISHTDETEYVEHALINIKPRLQPAGNSLETIDLSILLRAEITSIQTTLAALKKSKDTFEVLPLIMGNGVYKGDYVITSLTDSTLVALEDGTPVAVAVSISLKEFVVADKLAQQQNAARKNAFAVGDIIPSRQIPPVKYTPAQLTSKDLAMTVSHSINADTLARQFENNPSRQYSISEKIKASLQNMDGLLTAANEKINTITNPPGNIGELLGNMGNVKNIISNFTFPISNVAELRYNNNNLQDAVRLLKASATPLNNLVTTRNG